MADGADISPAEESSGSSGSLPQGSPSPSQRQILAKRLSVLAKALTETFEHLRDDWPEEFEEELEESGAEGVASYWSNGLLEVKQGVKNCQEMAGECRTFITGDEGRRLLKLPHRQLEKAINQFGTAIRQARSATLAATHALESPQDPTRRADLYEKAVDQLADLGERCTGLATQMLGEQSLPPTSRAAPAAEGV